MPDHFGDYIKQMTCVLYRPSLDAVAAAGNKFWPAEDGGNFTGQILDGHAQPERFLRTMNIKRESVNCAWRASSREFIGSVELKDVPNGIGEAHTHPNYKESPDKSLTYLAHPSIGDTAYIIANKIPFEVVVATAGNGTAYLRIFGSRPLSDDDMFELWEELYCFHHTRYPEESGDELINEAI